MPKQALILKRVSTDRQRDNYSPESQEAGCREYARSIGYEIAIVLMEVASGAVEFNERPIMGEVLDAIRNRKVDAIIIHRVNRATRAGGIHTLVLAQECERHHVELHFVDGVVKGLVDISNTAGKIMLLIAGDQAHEERNSLIEAMSRGRRTRATNHGRPLVGRRVKYGWSWVDEHDLAGKLIPKARAEILEPEAMIVYRMYVEAAHGIPIRTIARHLMEDGVVNTLGEPKWSHGVVRKILTDPHYKGVAYAFVSKKVPIEGEGKKYKTVPAPEEDRVLLPPGTFPAIIDPELWRIVQDRLAESKARSIRHNRYPERSLFRGGFVVCAECGNHLSVKNLTNGRAKYWCSPTPWNREKCSHPTISTAILDAKVWTLLVHLLRHPEIIQHELEKQTENDSQELRDDVVAYQRVLDPIVTREKMLIAMMSDAVDDFQRQEMQAQLSQVAKQRQAAQQAVNQAQRRLDLDQQETQVILATTHVLSLLAQRVDTLTMEERRTVARALVEKIWLWPAAQTPRWHIKLRIPQYVAETLVPDDMVNIANSIIPR